MRCENMAMTMWYQAKLACFGISLKYDMRIQWIEMKDNGQQNERGYECQRDKGWYEDRMTEGQRDREREDSW